MEGSSSLSVAVAPNDKILAHIAQAYTPRKDLYFVPLPTLMATLSYLRLPIQVVENYPPHHAC